VTDETILENTALTNLPWEAPDLFPVKPKESEFGYTVRGKPVGCSREQLADAIRRIDVPAGLVWTPDAPRLVSPEEVPFLFDAVRERETREATYSLKTALIHLLMWPALFVYYLLFSDKNPTIFLILFLAFGVVPAIQAINTRRKLRRANAIDMSRAAMSLRYGAWLGTRKMMATWIFVGLLVAVFLAQFLSGMQRSINAAGLVKPLVFQNGEYWRLLTCTVLHGDILHIAFNALALITLGRLMEAHAHPIYLPVTFLFSAICGSLASLYMTPDGPPSVGASGGLMGMIGFLLVMGYRRKDVLPQGFLKAILFSIALILGIGLIAAGMIDNAAHLGGLAGGIVLGLVYITRRRTRNYRLQPSVPANIAGAMCMGVIFVIAGLAVWKIVKMG